MERQAMQLAEPAAPAVTPDQLELLRNTFAKDATADELKLYLYDCHRQGVHPLDKLIHFTKRSGRYVPITSIDLMRMRAADTGEYIGNDQYEFSGTPGRHDFRAVARVWRYVNGQRCSFTREARWDEFCPNPGQDHMWRRMPHVMLGKVAEAQALRAGFPRQLHGLYAAEEMQAGESSSPFPPPKPTKTLEKQATEALDAVLEQKSADRKKSADRQISAEPVNDPGLPGGYVQIERVDETPTKNPNVVRHVITVSTGETFTTINTWIASLAKNYIESQMPVRLKTKPSKYGLDVVAIRTADEPDPEPVLPPDDGVTPF